LRAEGELSEAPDWIGATDGADPAFGTWDGAGDAGADTAPGDSTPDPPAGAEVVEEFALANSPARCVDPQADTTVHRAAAIAATVFGRGRRRIPVVPEASDCTAGLPQCSDANRRSGAHYRPEIDTIKPCNI
jgi:hypothetical protein